MPQLPIVEHPCAVCGGPNLRPFPACEKLECRQAWRRQGVARSKRERYALLVAEGRCGDCGVMIRENETCHLTPKKGQSGKPQPQIKPIGRCAACRAEQAAGKQKERARKSAARRAERALEGQIARDVQRHKNNLERIERGLPITRAGNPALPKQPPGRMDL